MKRCITLLPLLVFFTFVCRAQKLSYAAVVLDSASHALLCEFTNQHLPWPDAKIYCHHSTIAHHSNITPDILAWVTEHEGEHITLLCTEMGVSQKAFALKVEPTSAIPCVNAIRHITLATNPATDGHAVDSNYIPLWHPLHQPFLVQGTIQRIWQE